MGEVRASPWIRLRGPRQNTRSGPIIAALVVLTVLLLGWWTASRRYEALLLSELRAQAAVRASLRGNALALAIERRFALLQGLHAYVRTEASKPGLQVGFEVYAEELYKAPSARGVRNIALSPDGVVCCVYPLAGNEATIGYVPLADSRPQVRQDVERALATDEIILSGPLELVQGGLGLIARRAVYLPTQGEQADIFWGLVSIVLDLPMLLDEVDLDAQNETALAYGLRDAAGRVFSGDPAVFDQDPVIHVIHLREGVWELAGVPGEGWQGAVQRPLRIFQIAGLLIAVLAAGLTYLSVRHQVELAQAFARQKAITEQTVRLHAQSEQLAVFEERQRIARELHDSVSQALYGIGLGARTALGLLERDPERAVDPVQYILSLAEGGLAEMRALILELRPDSLEREGLVSALNKRAAALCARNSLEVETVLGAEPDLAVKAKEGLYRIAQEALNNIVKHSAAERVVIELHSGQDETVLTVQDDGVGFDTEEAYPGHIGLQTMRERAEKLGATLRIESAPGQGTRVRLILSHS